MRRAAAVLGAEPPILLGYPDMELDTLPAGVLREKFIRTIRQLKPDVLVAEDPYAPFEPHPDHRAVAWAATEAINYAGLPLVHPEHLAEGLALHLVVEKYFYANVPTLANKCIDISEALARKLAALAEHKSQMVFLVAGVMREAEVAGLDIPGDVRRLQPTTRPRCLPGPCRSRLPKSGSSSACRTARSTASSASRR